MRKWSWENILLFFKEKEGEWQDKEFFKSIDGYQIM
jgi:hypothetical protein